MHSDFRALGRVQASACRIGILALAFSVAAVLSSPLLENIQIRALEDVAKSRYHESNRFADTTGVNIARRPQKSAYHTHHTVQALRGSPLQVAEKTEWCGNMKHKHSVKPGIAWGSLGGRTNMQLQWMNYECDTLLPEEHSEVRKYRNSMNLCHELQTRYAIVFTAAGSVY
jgi:hypothetical protein